MSLSRVWWFLAVVLLGPEASAQPSPDPASSRAERPRLVVTTDGEVDDRSSFVHFLLYTTDFDVAGIITTNSKWQPDGHGTGWILDLLDHYEAVRPTLLVHDPRYPEADALRDVVARGNEDRARMNAVGPGRDTPGSRLIEAVLTDADPRPVWLLAWGGTNTLAQALWRLRTSAPADVWERARSKARIYAIADQDSTVWWLRDAMPEVPLILSYQFMALNYEHEGHPYSDHPLFSEAWMRRNVREGHGPLGAAYPQAYLSEGDSPAFFHLIDTGLRSEEHPSFGGWGGRFAPERPTYWRDAKDDGDALKPQWRWLPALANDFAARMDWCAAERFDEANHPPMVRLVHPDTLTIRSGEPVRLDASGTTDPDGDRLDVRWWVYPEAGTYESGPVEIASAGPTASFVAPEVESPQTLHLIVAAQDYGTPSLTRYGRVVVTVLPAR